MKKLTALQGRADLGKTDTIRKVFDLLLSKYPKAKYQELRPQRKDIKYIVAINGLKIGIESQGDPNSELGSSLRMFSETGCDIIICAVRTRGQTKNLVENMRQIYSVQYIEQSIVSTNYESNNLKKAKKILSSVGL